ncbi:hypothetical protein FOA52_004219 [Chlamydomonas sp. UWO 241]|nr:hypothetical protein FOA52_004219 [Chlamydomonas sp. UWO 241]
MDKSAKAFMLGDTRIITGDSSNVHEYAEIYGEQNNIVLPFSRQAMCAFNALHRPSVEAESVMATALAAMGVDPHKPYVAIHLRTWNVVGGDNTAKGAHTVENEDRLATSMMCARKMAARPECGGPGDPTSAPHMPIVLVTDNHHLRKRCVLGLYSGLACSDIVPHHFNADISRLRGNPASYGHPGLDSSDEAAVEKAFSELVQKFLETVADMLVLARSSALIADHESGFSRIAAYIGGPFQDHIIPPLNATCASDGGTAPEPCYQPSIEAVLPCRCMNQVCTREYMGRLYKSGSEGRGYDLAHGWG